MSDYELQIKIRNGRLLQAMKDNGITSAKELSQETGIPQGTVYNMLNLKHSLFVTGTFYGGSNGIRSNWEKAAAFLGVHPFDLVPVEFYEKELEHNNYAQMLSAQELEMALPVRPEFILEELSDEIEKKELIEKVMDKLNPRQRRVIEMRFDEGKTFEECGSELGVTGNRVRQIEQSSLRRMKNLWTGEDFESAQELAKNA